MTESPPLLKPRNPVDAVCTIMLPNVPVGAPPPNTTAPQSASSTVPDGKMWRVPTASETIQPETSSGEPLTLTISMNSSSEPLRVPSPLASPLMSPGGSARNSLMTIALVMAVAVVNVSTKSAPMLSGGSSASISLTCAAKTVTVQVSPSAKSVPGSSVKVVLSALDATAVIGPLVEQERSNHAPSTVTGSLKTTSILASSATPVSPSAGTVEATRGARSPAVRV